MTWALFALAAVLLAIVVQPDPPRRPKSRAPRLRIAVALLGALVIGQSADRRRRLTPPGVRAVVPAVAQQPPDAGVDGGPPRTMLAPLDEAAEYQTAREPDVNAIGGGT